jgi:hypothetical protein
VRGCGALSQDGVRLGRDVLDLHTRHGAIMAPSAPNPKRTLIGRTAPCQRHEHAVPESAHFPLATLT